MSRTRSKSIYKTGISDKRWWVYDIFGNIGWILYVIMVVVSFTKHEKAFVSIIAAVPAVFMLIGIAELIRERIRKLDRELPMHCLVLGFGSLTFGGLLGLLFSIAGAAHHFSICHLIAAIGGLLCFIFAGLLLKGYKKKKNA